MIKINSYKAIMVGVDCLAEQEFGVKHIYDIYETHFMCLVLFMFFQERLKSCFLPLFILFIHHFYLPERAHVEALTSSTFLGIGDLRVICFGFVCSN